MRRSLIISTLTVLASSTFAAEIHQKVRLADAPTLQARLDAAVKDQKLFNADIAAKLGGIETNPAGIVCAFIQAITHYQPPTIGTAEPQCDPRAALRQRMPSMVEAILQGNPQAQQATHAIMYTLHAWSQNI